MKLYFISIIILFITGCSFDNKAGIWTSEKDLKRIFDASILINKPAPELIADESQLKNN